MRVTITPCGHSFSMIQLAYSFTICYSVEKSKVSHRWLPVSADFNIFVHTNWFCFRAEENEKVIHNKSEGGNIAVGFEEIEDSSSYRHMSK